MASSHKFASRFAGIRKLLRELLYKFLADLIASALDGRPQPDDNVSQIAAGFAHSFRSPLGDAGKRSAPSRVHKRDGASDAIG